MLVEREQIGEFNNPLVSGIVDELLEAAREGLRRRKRLDGMSVRLSPAQKGILYLIVEGFTAEEIATRKVISLRTVYTHTKNIRAKLRVPERMPLRTWVIAVLRGA